MRINAILPRGLALVDDSTLVGLDTLNLSERSGIRDHKPIIVSRLQGIKDTEFDHALKRPFETEL
jgi:hypothetical protein